MLFCKYSTIFQRLIEAFRFHSSVDSLSVNSAQLDGLER